MSTNCYPFCVPPFSNLVCCPVIFTSQQFRKFRHAHFYAAVLHYAIGAFVALLLFLGSPSAVFFAVPKIVINPVDRVKFRWAMPHVVYEILIGKPLFGNCNIPFCIPSSLQCFIAFPSGEHVLPATISSASVFSVNYFCLRYFWSNTFSATTASSSSQLISENIYFSSAGACAHPPRISSFSIFTGSLNYRPRSKFLTRNVFDVWMKYDSFILVLAHVMNGLSSSAGQSASTAGRCAYFTGCLG